MAMEAGGGSSSELYQDAVVDGVLAAAARMAELGLDARDAAWGSTRPEISDTVRRVLSAEGAAATLRVLDAANAPGSTLPDAQLMDMVRDLHANPWDAGALRARAVYVLDNNIDAYSEKIAVPSSAQLHEHLENTVSEERRGVGWVAGRIVEANDRDVLRARVNAAVQQTAQPAMSADRAHTQLHGRERYAGSRDPAASARRGPGLER